MSSLDYRALSRIHAESALTFEPQLFAKYWNSLDKSAPVRILDLASVQSTSIDFYSNSEIPCFITIADCINRLSALLPEEITDPVKINEILDELIPANTKPYDLVLLWDYPNYLQPGLSACLEKKLKQVTHKKSILYGYLYTAKSVSRYPNNFKIQNQNSMACDEKTELLTKPESINSISLKKYFHDFQLSRSVLIRNGLQEIIMQRNS